MGCGGSTGILRCVTTTAQSFPRIPTEVTPSLLMALNAYSSTDMNNHV